MAKRNRDRKQGGRRTERAITARGGRERERGEERGAAVTSGVEGEKKEKKSKAKDTSSIAAKQERGMPTGNYIYGGNIGWLATEARMGRVRRRWK